MFERMANGWELAKESFGVLKLDKGLLLFPLISLVSCLLVMGSFALPLWNSDYLKVILEDGKVPEDPVAYVLLFAFYFVNYFVIVFFNSALVACAVIRFQGGDPTVSDGLSAARMRLPQIVAWAAVAATVGMILKLIESRSEKVGQLVAGLLGMAWSVTTYFVVPVLVMEKVGPADAIKRSLAILRKNWGESLAANFGIGLIAFLFLLPAGLLVFVGAVVVGMGNGALGTAIIVLGFVLLILVSLVKTALDSILLAALYLYAVEGDLPRHFNAGLLQHAFARK
jgi:hypothetical protein